MLIMTFQDAILGNINIEQFRIYCHLINEGKLKIMRD